MLDSRLLGCVCVCVCGLGGVAQFFLDHVGMCVPPKMAVMIRGTHPNRSHGHARVRAAGFPWDQLFRGLVWLWRFHVIFVNGSG